MLAVFWRSGTISHWNDSSYVVVEHSYIPKGDNVEMNERLPKVGKSYAAR